MPSVPRNWNGTVLDIKEKGGKEEKYKRIRERKESVGGEEKIQKKGSLCVFRFYLCLCLRHTHALRHFQVDEEFPNRIPISTTSDVPLIRRPWFLPALPRVSYSGHLAFASRVLKPKAKIKKSKKGKNSKRGIWNSQSFFSPQGQWLWNSCKSSSCMSQGCNFKCWRWFIFTCHSIFSVLVERRSRWEWNARSCSALSCFVVFVRFDRRRSSFGCDDILIICTKKSKNRSLQNAFRKARRLSNVSQAGSFSLSLSLSPSFPPPPFACSTE